MLSKEHDADGSIKSSCVVKFSCGVTRLSSAVTHGGCYMNKKKNVLSEWLSGEYFAPAVRHPFITAGILCLLCFTLTTGRINLISISINFTAILTAALLAVLPRIKKRSSFEKIVVIAMVVMLSLSLAYLLFYSSIVDFFSPLIIINMGLAVSAFLFFYFAFTRTLSMGKVILLLFFTGFAIRLAYVVAVPITVVQHDVYNIAFDNGHLGYIRYLYENGHLPDFDVTTVDQYYHPPLHHIIAALWFRFQTFVGIDYYYAYQNIQLLTLFYSSACMILSYKIFRILGLKKSGLISATAVIVFCPTFYIMAGGVNNDILSITFFLGAVLNTLYWYKDRTIGRILCIALCIGLGMMTKLSVWMAAPAVAFVFIYVFFKELKSFRKYILQYLAFLGVSVPLGFFWSVRNFIGWGVPFTFVQKLSETAEQYVGNVPLMTRLFDFSLYQFEDVAEQFTQYGGKYNEFNPLVGLFKTSVFDEEIAVRRFEGIAGFNHVLFWSAVVVGLIGFAAMIYMFVKKSSTLTAPLKIFIGLIYFVLMGCYYLFCIEFPHVCTENIRYAVPVMIVGALSLGYLVYDMLSSGNKAHKAIGGAICSAVGVYALSGIVVFEIVIAQAIEKYHA